MTQILLIDDDDTLRAMLARTLTHFGYFVVEARNGAEGLDLFFSVGADLVVTDIVMPEKEGFEVLIELRKIHPLLGIIVMSGGGRHSPAEVLHIAKHLGASRVLAKPFPIEQLVTAIKELLVGSGDCPLPVAASE
jgi:DNA-binding response OmpR family regulator